MTELIKKKIVCGKCKKVFYCDNSCESPKNGCFCSKCFHLNNSDSCSACEYRCKQLNKPIFIFR